jgi:copper chaperone CopZ
MSTTNQTTATTTLKAPDIECGGCANAIKKAVGALPGVSGVDVDVETKVVTVTHDAQAAPRAAIENVLDRAGFPVAA